MKRQTGHPDMEALANFRVGLVEGSHGRRIAAHIAGCERCTRLSDQLSAVEWALASIPAPSMPDAVERRIGAAIAAEASARRVASPTASSVADPSAAASLTPTSAVPARPATAERRQARRWSPRRALRSAGPRLRLSPVQVLVPVAACLLLAGLGYLLSASGVARTPSSAGAASASGKVPASHGLYRGSAGPTGAIGSAAGSRGATFLVTDSAIQYQKSKLRAQVNSQLARNALATNAPAISGASGSESNGGNSPGNQGGTSTSNTVSVPSKSLVGCVMRLTGGAQPALVQRAAYQAEPAYVIAVLDRAWVVHLDCTAANLALITSVTLAPTG